MYCMGIWNWDLVALIDHNHFDNNRGWAKEKVLLKNRCCLLGWMCGSSNPFSALEICI